MPVLTKIVRHDPNAPTDEDLRVLGWAAFPETPDNPAVFSMHVDGKTDLWMVLGHRWSVPLVDAPTGDGKLPGAHLEVHVVTLVEFDQMQKMAQTRARFTAPPGAAPRMHPNGIPRMNGN